MKYTKRIISFAAGSLVATLGCAGWDNPTAIADLETDVEFEIEVARVETFEEVEIHIHAMQDGVPTIMQQPALQITAHGSDVTRTVALDAVGDAYTAHVMFFEAGEHHLQLMGMPERHGIVGEIGETEIEVEHQHRDVGPYWIEMEVPGGEVHEETARHIHLHVHELLPDGTPGDEVYGLQLAVEMHFPGGTEAVLEAVEEEAGEYEVEAEFGKVGIYELHVEIEVNGVEFGGEFTIPIQAPDQVEEDPATDTGGHDHGN